MQDEMHKQRWIEIQFYCVLKDAMQFCKDILQLLDWLDAMNIFQKYNANAIKQYAMEFLQTPWIQPTREEIALLAYQNDTPITAIKKWTGYHNRTLYRNIAREKEEERLFMPRYKTEQIQEIQKFLDYFYNIKEWGI